MPFILQPGRETLSVLPSHTCQASSPLYHGGELRPDGDRSTREEESHSPQHWCHSRLGHDDCQDLSACCWRSLSHAPPLNSSKLTLSSHLISMLEMLSTLTMPVWYLLDRSSNAVIFNFTEGIGNIKVSKSSPTFFLRSTDQNILERVSPCSLDYNQDQYSPWPCFVSTLWSLASDILTLIFPGAYCYFLTFFTLPGVLIIIAALSSFTGLAFPPSSVFPSHYPTFSYSDKLFKPSLI